MKKILSIACFTLLVLSSRLNAQSNLTWIAKDKIEDNTFKTRLEFHVAVAGLMNDNEANSFCDKMRTNKDLESCVNSGKDSNGSYLITFKMKKVNESIYYIGWAQKLGIAYIEAKGQRKTPAEWARADKK